MVYLFNDQDGAAGYLDDSIVDDFSEGLDDPELSFRVVETFDVDIGDQSTGADIEGAVQNDDGSSVPLSGSVIYFRHGRVTAALSMFGLQLEEAEKQRMEDSAKQFASLMNDRITGVLAT